MPIKVFNFCVEHSIIWNTDDKVKKIKFKKDGRRVDIRIDYLTLHPEESIEEIKKGLKIFDKTW